MKMMRKMKNRSHHGPKYTKYKMCLSIMVICIMQHPSNIWSSIHEKVHKKGIAYKKSKNDKTSGSICWVVKNKVKFY